MLARYGNYFELFGSFRGFVEHFLLQDAVTIDCDAVVFCAPFDGFSTPAMPQTMDEYREYRQRSITFVEARNRRILRFLSAGHSRDLREGERIVRAAVALETPPAGTGLTQEAVLELAGQCGTRKELERAIDVASRKGFHVRPFKACLMFTPPSDGRRCLFTLWAGREDGKLTAYVSTDSFPDLLPVERADVEQHLGEDGWRQLDGPGFDAFLRGIEALDLSS